MHWELLLLITFIAATVQSATGFGFGLITVSAFLIILNSVAAIQLVMIITLIMSTVHWLKLKGLAPPQLLLWLVLGSVLGFPIGILIYNQVNLNSIKIIVAVLIILISLQNGWQLFLDRKKTDTKSSSMQSKSIFAVGVVSGLMSTCMAMPGPSVMLYLSRTNLTKDQIRATILTFFLFSYGGALLLQSLVIGVELQTWRVAAALSPAALLGVVTGHYLSKMLNQQLFKAVVLAILIFTGVFMLLNL